jgi:hypothetical protein
VFEVDLQKLNGAELVHLFVSFVKLIDILGELVNCSLFMKPQSSASC